MKKRLTFSERELLVLYALTDATAERLLSDHALPVYDPEDGLHAPVKREEVDQLRARLEHVLEDLLRDDD